MTRSEALRRSVGVWCRRWEMLPPGELVLCAVSGGRDSMALLHLLSVLAGEEGFRLAAAHFNHRLRPTADRDEALVRTWCAQRGIPLTCGGGDAAAYARQAGRSLEDAARTLRYEFLEAAAASLAAARIATAHHREDNAETVLLHLLRGSGLRGLGGIPPVRGRIVRPLLETSRADIDVYIEENHIPYGDDETNQDPRYTRNRLRLEVMPLLEDISPGAAARISAAASLLREDEAHLRREAETLLPPAAEGPVTLPAALPADTALAGRVVRAAARRLGGELTHAQTAAVLSLPPGGCQDLPGGIRAVRRRGRLTLEKLPPRPAPAALEEGERIWGAWRVCVSAGSAPAEERVDTAVLPAEGGPVTLAAWDGRGRLAVENGSRSIKRLFADRGIPPERREAYPALYREGRCIGVLGVAWDRSQRPQPGRRAIIITMEPLRNNEEGERAHGQDG